MLRTVASCSSLAAFQLGTTTTHSADIKAGRRDVNKHITASRNVLLHLNELPAGCLSVSDSAAHANDKRPDLIARAIAAKQPHVFLITLIHHR